MDFKVVLLLKKYIKIILFYSLLFLSFSAIKVLITFKISKLSISDLFYIYISILIINFFIVLYSFYTYIQIKFFHTIQGSKLKKKQSKLL